METVSEGRGRGRNSYIDVEHGLDDLVQGLGIPARQGRNTSVTDKYAEFIVCLCFMKRGSAGTSSEFQMEEDPNLLESAKLVDETTETPNVTLCVV